MVTYITGSAKVMTLNAIGSPFQFQTFGAISTPRSGAQDIIPPAGSITTADVITSISLINDSGNKRRIRLSLGSFNRYLYVNPDQTYLFRQNNSPGWVKASSIVFADTVAGYNPSTGLIGSWFVESITTDYMSPFKGAFYTFRGDTTIKALFLNDIYVKID